MLKDQVEESLKSETKTLEKEGKDITRAVQEVQCLINRDIREQTKERSRHCQMHWISLGSPEKKNHSELCIL